MKTSRLSTAGRVAAAVVLLSGAVRLAAAEPDEARRFEEVYARLLAAEGEERQDLAADLARTTLGTELASPELPARWAALRSAGSLRDAEITRRVSLLAQSPDRYEQSLALDVLGRVDPRAHQIAFLTALDSEHRSVRLRALQGLSSLAEPDFVSRFATVVERDPDPDIRALAARALGQTNSREAIPPLHTALANPELATASEAVKALARLKDPQLAALLRERLRDPAFNRVDTVNLAAHARDMTLVDDLVPLLRDADGQLRVAAAASILSLSEAREEKR